MVNFYTLAQKDMKAVVNSKEAGNKDQNMVTDRKTWARQQRRNRILDLAQDLFFKNGVEQTTVNDIASAAGYNKRTLYLYFKDREEIFLSVVARGQYILRDNLRAVMEDNPDPGTILNQIGQAFFNYFQENSEFFKLLMLYESRNFKYFGVVEYETEIQAECQRLSDEYGQYVMSAIELARESQQIQSKLEARQLMLILWGQLFGFLQVLQMRREQFDNVFGISQEELFTEFLAMVDKSLH